MSANILEQSKEIGMMRAIGLEKKRIVMLYIYESFILIMASAFLGVIIGTIVGITMYIQQAIFIDMPVQFYFPWKQFLVVFFSSILCAFASTYGPTKNLLKKDIS